uniref:Reverse transcriptase Ty1/copia-type domain-containing protein n=1 Tax=Tanacetum cinerariifolium TaxID=118510 RepID=A0A6L2MVQ3_TANCI|nr:hypothetical protein [Tanacetum cinerariifolium]
MCDEFTKIMHDEFEMSMMGELNFFFGLQIKQIEDGIFFNQSKYIKEMLKKFGLEDSKQMKTPMSSDTKLTKDKECPISYLLSAFVPASKRLPKPLTLEAVKRIFRYIKGPMHLGLWYPKRTGIETVKQTALAISTIEVEYVSAGKACQQALWMKQALIDYDIRLDDVPIMYDNKDRGKKRSHKSNASSSSTTLNHPSSYHSLNDVLDENDDESFHFNSLSSSQNISSSSNVVSRVRQNHPRKSHNLNSYLSETINLQTQQQDAHREGLRLIE